MMSSAAVRLLENDIDTFVRQRIPETPGYRHTSNDILHDQIWGYVRLYPWEWDIIDTQLFWRLRWLHQTSLFFYVYLSATHTRLEHSIGVMAGAESILHSLESHGPKGLITPVGRMSVRLAALLPDIGHTIFSHIGEQQLSAHPWIKALRESDPIYQSPKVHELLSALIVRSRPFREFFESVVDTYSQAEPALCSVQLEEVAGFILGHASPEHTFLAEIINGPFDADKLDYLQRDSLHTGMPIVFDLHKLLASCTCVSVDSEQFKRLAVRERAAPVLEQILFNKLMFATRAIEHHRVRAANAVFNKYFQHVRANEGMLPETERFNTPSAFLRRSDAEWLQGGKPLDELSSLSELLLTRNLPKRVLKVSSRTIEGPHEFERLQEAIKSPGFVAHIEQSILDTVAPYSQSHTLTIRDIYVDLPAVPVLGESGRALVLKRDGVVSSLEDYLSLDRISRDFAMKEWSGFVFANVESKEQLLKTAKAAAEVFQAEGFSITDEAIKGASLSIEDVWAAY
jgi:HD superfamily phosphohydrolase